jgi:hypothetical protein
MSSFRRTSENMGVGVLTGEASAWAGTITDWTTGLLHLSGSTKVATPPIVAIFRTRLRPRSASPEPCSGLSVIPQPPDLVCVTSYNLVCEVQNS